LTPESSAPPDLGQLLQDKFPKRHVQSMLEHYRVLAEEFQKANWEASTLRGGKFIEATLKALWAHVGNPIPKSKDFKVDGTIRGLEQVQAALAGDSIRLTIPRACRFVYEIASNRGARHDPDEVDPNSMDCTVVVATCSWILGEMLRYSQKGALDLTATATAVAALNERRFPFMERVDGKVYFHLKDLSARDVALLTLWDAHPSRMSKTALIETAKRHGSSEANAKMGVSRVRRVADDDGRGNLRLLAPGIKEAEALILHGSRLTSSLSRDTTGTND